MTVYLWGWFDVALRVRSGDVATDLQRPLDFQAYWLAQDLGRAAYHALFRGVPPFIFGALRVRRAGAGRSTRRGSPSSRA